MKGDYSRFSFDRRKHYSGVRMQQGRVQLDADWNEQADILQHLMRSQLVDLIGPHGTTTRGGFQIETTGPSGSVGDGSDVVILPGHYYVDGILCENDVAVQLQNQPHLPADLLPLPTSADGQYLVYLDVWQRHVTAIEDPAIKEPALSDADTATRLQTTWQVRLLPMPQASEPLTSPSTVTGESKSATVSFMEPWTSFLEQRRDKATLSIRYSPEHEPSDQAEPIDARGVLLDNRLYRIEVHQNTESGGNWSEALGNRVACKWSRDNGSVTLPIKRFDQDESDAYLTLQVEGLQRHGHQFGQGDWVEISDQHSVLASQAQSLWQITQPPDLHAGRIRLHAGDAAIDLESLQKIKQPLLRKWDQQGQVGGGFSNGVIEVDRDQWFYLESGLWAKFHREGSLLAGDYWVIPTRNARPGVGWPEHAVPHGIDHHYAPLAVVDLRENQFTVVQDCRQVFDPLTEMSAVQDQDTTRLKSLIEERVRELGGDLTSARHAMEKAILDAVSDTREAKLHFQAKMDQLAETAKGLEELQKQLINRQDSHATSLQQLQVGIQERVPVDQWQQQGSVLEQRLEDSSQEWRETVAEIEKGIRSSLESTDDSIDRLADRLEMVESADIEAWRPELQRVKDQIVEIQERLKSLKSSSSTDEGSLSECLGRLESQNELIQRLEERLAQGLAAEPWRDPIRSSEQRLTDSFNELRPTYEATEESIEQLAVRLKAIESKPVDTWKPPFQQAVARINKLSQNLADLPDLSQPVEHLQQKLAEQETLRTQSVQQLGGQLKEQTDPLRAAVKQISDKLKKSLPAIQSAFSTVQTRLERAEAVLDQGLSKEDIAALEPERITIVAACDRELQLGDVVSIDGKDDLRFVAAHRFNQSMVAGVVSEKLPSVMEGQWRYRVVLHGITHCKVVGRIRPGHLLVPSWRRGQARKAKWFIPPGTLIGKALGRPDSGQVRVLVMLG